MDRPGKRAHHGLHVSQDVRTADLPVGNRPNGMPPALRIEIVAEILVLGIQGNPVGSGDRSLKQAENNEQRPGPKHHHIPNRLPYGSISHSQSSNRNSSRIANRAIRPITV